jgi:hypothetical protein
VILLDDGLELLLIRSITSDAGLFSERGVSVDSCDIVALDRDHDFGNSICSGRMGHARKQA